MNGLFRAGSAWLWLNESSVGNTEISEETKGITPDQPDPQRGSTMSRKIISTFTAAAMSMSIALAVPVTVTAVSSVAVVSEAQGGWGSFKNSVKSTVKQTGKNIKRKAKKVKRVVKRNCFSGHQGICGRAWDPDNFGKVGRGIKKTVKRVRIPKGRIGDLPNIHDHRQKPPSGVAITYNPLRWR